TYGRDGNALLTQSLAYVQFEESQQAKLGFRVEVEFNGASDPLLFRSFASLPRENGEVGKHLEWTGERVSVGISPSYAFDAQDDKKYRLDGSYAAITLGNWVFGVGALERWWGPGWHKIGRASCRGSGGRAVGGDGVMGGASRSN